MANSNVKLNIEFPDSDIPIVMVKWIHVLQHCRCHTYVWLVRIQDIRQLPLSSFWEWQCFFQLSGMCRHPVNACEYFDCLLSPQKKFYNSFLLGMYFTYTRHLESHLECCNTLVSKWNNLTKFEKVAWKWLADHGPDNDDFFD